MIGEKPAGAVIGWFVAINGNQMGEDFRVREGHNVLGSSPECEIVLDDGTVSAKHASLKHKDGKFLLTDLDSTNGTFVNDKTDSIAREKKKKKKKKKKKESRSREPDRCGLRAGK